MQQCIGWATFTSTSTLFCLTDLQKNRENYNKKIEKTKKNFITVTPVLTTYLLYVLAAVNLLEIFKVMPNFMNMMSHFCPAKWDQIIYDEVGNKFAKWFKKIILNSFDKFVVPQFQIPEFGPIRDWRNKKN